MLFKSVKFKFLLWYIMALAVTLSIFGFILYEGFRKNLYDDFDDLLSSRAEGIADSVDTYWKNSLDKSNFVDVARVWVEEKRKDPDLMSIFVQILNRDGRPMVSSRSMPNITPIDKDDFEDAINGEDSFDTVKGSYPDGRRMKFRVYSKPVFENNRVEYVVQVAGPMSLVSLALGNLRIILFILIPLTVILAGIPGFFLARLTLDPVTRMIDTLRQITAENLKLKIHMPDTKDEIKRLADTFNDMIDRLDRSFSSQQKLIQSISNRLKEPLGMLKEELDECLNRKCSQEEYNKLLSKASGEIKFFDKAMEGLLTISRLDESQLFLEIRRVDLTKLVKNMVNDIKVLSDQKDISVNFSSSADIMIDGDENQLKRLLMNLLDNAIKYTPRKGSVNIEVSKHESSAKLMVSDTGVGIPNDELPYIFDRFYQVAGSRSAKKGFGLGLSSVKAIVEAHKGRILAESDEGEGASFTVLLPLSYPG